MAPLSGEIKPAIILKRVVFPHPDGPKIEKNSPSFISKFIFFKTSIPSKFFFISTILISFFSNKLFYFKKRTLINIRVLSSKSVQVQRVHNLHFFFYKQYSYRHSHS